MSVLKIATYSSDNRWFNTVMATVIIAVVSQLYGFERISPYFFITGLVALLSVIVFMIVRIVLFNKDAINDLLNPEKSLYFFAIISAINFAGMCFSMIFHMNLTASIFWYVAITLWVVISLSTFSILFLHGKSRDRKFEDILHGGWFFATAGTQSTALLGIIVTGEATKNILFIHIFSFALWSIGACLYIIFIALIIFRLFFFQFKIDTLLSPYWMNMGAAALTAITGIELYQHISIMGGPFMEFLPFLKGISLFFWSAGLWWLPFLIILAIRKQVFSKEGLVFTVGYWEIAFTLGLYAHSSNKLFCLFGGQYLNVISICFYIVCIIFWCFSSIFTLVHLVRSSIWVPVNDLTINYVIPYSFRLRGRLFKVKEVVNEWVDQSIQGVLKKRYCIVTTNNITCHISCDLITKKWYFDLVKD